MDEDGFVRTLPDIDEAEEGSLSDGSCLEFGSDGDTQGEGQLNGTTRPFFSVAAPAAWSFRGARAEAEASRPFQTTIDHKIRNARAAVLSDVPKPLPAGDDEESGDSVEVEDSAGAEGSEHARKKSAQGKDDVSTPRTRDDIGEGPESDRELSSAEAPELESSEPQKEKRVGKKRARKAAVSASASFESLNLSRPLLKAIERLQWTTPTPVQARAIPLVLAGRDVCGSAVTGSGKTGAFALPILERLLRSGVDNATRCIILLPTRELAAQCHAVITNLAKHTPVRAALAVGGLSNKAQEYALRSRPHIIVATPGRLIDHVRNAHSFSLDDIEILVMDEADRLLELGFKDEVEEILKCTPSEGRQTLLFSATMSPKLEGLMSLSLKKPVQLSVDPIFDVASTLSQEFVKLKPSHGDDKDAVLFSLVTRTFTSRTIIFFRQKVIAHRFKILFGLSDLTCAELHGNLTQAQRLEALDAFREGEVKFLLCTDLAARGLDIAGVETVVNYDMPGTVTEYVHRVGRTARAGALGRACSIVCTSSTDERKLLRTIAKRAKSQLVARAVQPAVVGKWRAWIDSLGDAVKAVLKEEKQEKQLRLAEMELSKADNMLKHSDEIYSRPARTWFQSTRQKEAAKDAARSRAGIPSRLDRQNKAKNANKPGSPGEADGAAEENAGAPQGPSSKRGKKRKADEEAAKRRKGELSERERDYRKQRSSKAKRRKQR